MTSHPFSVRPAGTTGPTRLARTAALLGLTALLGAAAGCASTASVSPAAPGPSAPASSSPTPRPVTVDERSAGKTVRVPVNGVVEMVLHNTYWSSPRDSAPELLQPLAAPTVTRAHTCPAGGGCGTVVQRFTARHTGTAVLSSGRSSCGEAMRCTGPASRLTVTIQVVPAS